MKRFFGLVLERLVFLSQNLEVGKCRKKKKLKSRKTKAAAVSERKKLLFYLKPIRRHNLKCVWGQFFSYVVCPHNSGGTVWQEGTDLFAEVCYEAGGG